MPGKDGTGPNGMGTIGGGGGRARGGGRGRMGGFSAGPGGECICPSCGKTVSHSAGTPCSSQTCPACGTVMTRK